MYDESQHAELRSLIAGQMQLLSEHLSKPMEAGDTIFIFKDLPIWLGEGLEHRFFVHTQPGPEDSPARFLVSMDVVFGEYHRRMDLVAGTREELYEFATVNPPIAPLCEAIYEVIAMERGAK